MRANGASASHICMEFLAFHYIQSYILKPSIKQLPQASLHLKARLCVLWYNPNLFLLEIMVYSFTIYNMVSWAQWASMSNEHDGDVICCWQIVKTLDHTNNIKIHLFYKIWYNIMYLYNLIIADLCFASNIMIKILYYFLHPAVLMYNFVKLRLTNVLWIFSLFS